MAYEPYVFQQQTQVSREELARARQAIHEMEHHLANFENQVRLMQSNVKTDEDAVKFSSALLELNRTKDALQRHVSAYNDMIRIANVEHTSRLSAQAKREIYHLYHSKRFTQDLLAAQYGVQQSTISKIVNGPMPT
ncbi:TPA: hypothetical protein R4057_002027 [Kluyvera ascorbata]|uniref:hypothetical protein n=1 Tax=Kluyvera ascorbata TaxID=51288 RepID=UPI00289D67E1|nr:hypothetical protein [Kluyvera ascorbata]HED3065074.1 hypothetical protein [Kluyvera ascorbata]